MKYIPYSEREEKLRPLESFNSTDEFLSYLTNEYIPRQPDSDLLMKAFLDLLAIGAPISAFVIKLISAGERPKVEPDA